MILPDREFSVALAIIAFPSTLFALTVDEYNGLSNDPQNRALSQIVQGTYDAYRDRGASDEWQSCVRQFFTQQEITINGETVIGIPGVHAVLDQIDMANRDNDLTVRVEDLVLGAINFHCGEP